LVFQQKCGGSVKTERNAEIKELWQKLLAQNPTNDDLRFVIEYAKPLRAKAWQKLLAQNPTNDDLRYVIVWVEPLKAEAEKILREREKTAEPPKPVVRERTKEDILRTLRDLSS
jgi:cytochrome c-type biogenesis protein CcmH/NrfG